MQKNRWSRKFDWLTVTGSTTTYIQQDRSETYKENRFIAVGDIYFKLNKYLTGVTFTYINSLKNVYKRDLLTGDGYSIFNMYNEYDVINRVLKNIVDVDIAADTNIDLSKQWFSINDVKLKPNQLILLKNQTSPFENDVYKVNKKYFLENAGLLSTREKSDKFSCSVKMGKNIDKQFFLNTNGGFDFPIIFESKQFVEGQSIILKNLIRYNMYNTYTGTTSGATTSKMIFTDYNFARKQLPENYSLYYEFNESVTLISIPSNFVTINYHHDFNDLGYKIRYGSKPRFNSYVTSGMTNTIGTKLAYSTPFNWITGDYINVTISSGSTPVLSMNTFIKTGSTNYVYLEETIPNKILSSLINCSYTVKNLNVANSWTSGVDSFYDRIQHTPYIDFYDISGKTSITTPGDFDMMVTPKECAYDKYFDYNALTFKFKDTYELKKFDTPNQYLKYNLYERLNQIYSGFTAGFTFYNSYILSGFTYQYTDKNRIKIISSQSGLTNIFKPYTYVYAFASPSEKTLIYSVKDHEIIIEKPANWIGKPVITAIQNIDGLQNISNILYDVYINDSYDWYISKSDTERKYISRSYGEILASNNVFRTNVTGLIFENDNNEYILKLYKIMDEDGNFVDPNLYFKTIELVFVGSESTSRLPVPLNIISGTTFVYSEDWNVLNDGYHEVSEGSRPDDVLDGRDTSDGRSCTSTIWNPSGVIGDTFDGGLDVVVPTNDTSLLYNVVDGGLEVTNNCCNLQLIFTTTNSTATVYVVYGQPNYTYLWNNGQNSHNNPSASHTATGLSALTTYSVSVIDGRGCETTGYVTIPATTTTTTSSPTTTTTTTVSTTTTTTLASTTTTTTVPTTTTTTVANTTTTTTPPTTTTTTTGEIILPIYWGTGTTTTVTESYILNNFSSAVTFVGSPTGKLYTFGTAFGTYRYWAIPDVPSGVTYGDRVINRATYTDGSTSLILLPPQISFYSNYQDNPTPCCQSIRYGIVNINVPGYILPVTYRLYRTLNTYNSSRTQFLIYSF